MADLSSICDGVQKLDPFGNAGSVDFVHGHENPVRWHETFNVSKEKLTKDVLFDNEDMRDITLAQYDGDDKPEYVKWKLLGYNLVIAYEYISKEKLDRALDIIHDTENILSSIGKDDPFLKSIKVALNHITYSMKGYVLKLCKHDIVVERFIMPHNMNKVNKAALFGIQALFFYEYGLTFAHISKDCALKAISLNDTEAEWYFLLARVLTNWQRTCTNLFECSKEEFNAAEMAVNLGNKNHHKIHLALVYQRMRRNMSQNVEAKNKTLEVSFKLLNEVWNDTDDLLLLKNCFHSLAKIALERPIMGKNCLQEILDQILVKLKSSDNGYVLSAIGNYYLFNKKDYAKANHYLKKAFDIKSFGSSIDYIYTFYKMDPDTAPVEQMLVGMLETFTHPVRQEKILSQIVSYLIITKKDFIQALKYVPKLLSIKNITCVYSLQTHRVKFTDQRLTLNLLDLLSEKLEGAINDPTLSTDYKNRVIEVTQIVEQFQNYVSILNENKDYGFGKNYKKDSCAKNDKPFNNNGYEDRWTKQDTVKQDVKKNDKVNWKTLKPNSNLAPNIFSGYNKQISSSGMEIKFRKKKN